MTSLDIDTRSDIYSLGVLLYELLTGRPPFGQKELLAVGLDEMRRTIRETEPLKPSTCLTLLGKDELTTAAQRRQTEALKLVHRIGKRHSGGRRILPIGIAIGSWPAVEVFRCCSVSGAIRSPFMQCA